MAKKRSSKVNVHKQTTKSRDPRTKAKQSSAAKHRRRVHGRFASGALNAAEESKAARARRMNPPKRESTAQWKAAREAQKGRSPLQSPRGKGKGGEMFGKTAGELKGDVLSRQYDNKKLVKENPDEAALRLSELQTQSVHGAAPPRDQLRDRPGGTPGRVKSTSGNRRDILQSQREGKWKSEAGLYTNPNATKKGKLPKYTAPSQFVNKELAPSHKQWLEGQLQDPSSAFNKGLPPEDKTHSSKGGKLHKTKQSPGQRNRIRLYSEALQRGESHQGALTVLQGERRGRPSTRVRGTMVDAGPSAESVGLGPTPHAGRKGKFVSSAPAQSDFDVGVSIPKVDTISELSGKFPGKTERELVETQQGQRQYLANEFAKNQRWAHETRAANLLGKNKMPGEGPDNVTVFTSSLGHPNVTVPTDSLVGQYIVRRRKNSLADMGYPRSQLRGRFPEAVRDKHVAEMLTGRHFGAQGRVGVFKRGGWRVGSKTSKGFGKPVPVGSQVIYDSAGRPMYDAQGNVRFSEGMTRPFSVGSGGEVGLGVYIG